MSMYFTYSVILLLSLVDNSAKQFFLMIKDKRKRFMLKNKK